MGMQVRTILIKLSSLVLASCSTPSSWIVSSIATGDLVFDSSRLRFVSSQAHSPLSFEMMKYGDHVEAFLCLNRFHFSSNRIILELGIEGKTFTEEVFVHEGAMRLKLSETTTQRMIQALQNGLEVCILIDGFEERLLPSCFPEEFKL